QLLEVQPRRVRLERLLDEDGSPVVEAAGVPGLREGCQPLGSSRTVTLGAERLRAELRTAFLGQVFAAADPFERVAHAACPPRLSMMSRTRSRRSSSVASSLPSARAWSSILSRTV